MAGDLRIVRSDAICRIGTWQNIVLMEVARDIDLEHMKLLGRTYEELAARHRQSGIAAVSVVRAGVPVASAESRQESARFLKVLGDSVLRIALVLEDKGLLAQMLQTVIRGINVLIRKPKVVIVPDQTEAVAVVAPMVQGVPSHRAQVELARAVAAFRAGYEDSELEAESA